MITEPIAFFKNTQFYLSFLVTPWCENKVNPSKLRVEFVSSSLILFICSDNLSLSPLITYAAPRGLPLKKEHTRATCMIYAETLIKNHSCLSSLCSSSRRQPVGCC